MITNHYSNKKVFFNKYRIKKLLYKSSMCLLYEGVNIETNESIAIKLEKKNINGNILENEAYYLITLKGYGIPKIITFGKNNYYNILIEELLGLSLTHLWFYKKEKSKDILLKNICMIALQGLERLEYIHSKNIIHRDIKPENTLFGKKDPNVLYLIDFALSKKYKSSRTGKHIKFQNIKKVFGSIMYMSLNAHKGYEQSRRDDLEAFGYMLVFLAKSLPWLKLGNKKISKLKLNNDVLKMKKSISVQELCKDLPNEFAEYINYSRKLEFEQEPNYKYLKNLFISLLNKNHQKIDYIFLWVKTEKKKNKSEDNSPGKIQNNFHKMKSSCQKRLYYEIKKSLDKAKSQEQNIKINFHLNNVKIPTKTKFKSKDIITPINGQMNFIYERKKIIGNNMNIIKKNLVNISAKKNLSIEVNSPFINYKSLQNNNNITSSADNLQKKFKKKAQITKHNIPFNIPNITKLGKNNNESNIFSSLKNTFLNISDSAGVEKTNFKLSNNKNNNYSLINIFNINDNKNNKFKTYRTLYEREHLKTIKGKKSINFNINLNKISKLYNIKKNNYINDNIINNLKENTNVAKNGNTLFGSKDNELFEVFGSKDSELFEDKRRNTYFNYNSFLVL